MNNKIDQIIADYSETGTLKKETVSGSPDQIIERTLFKMQELALRDSTAQMITKLTKQFKSCCKIKEAYNLVTEIVQYENDPRGMEYVRAPIHCLQERKGDCDDMATLYACLMKAMDIPVAFKAIAWRRYEFTHVYCLVFMKQLNKWVVADPVIKSFGKEKSGIIRDMILKV
jgi:hypothetical protein